MLDTYNPDIVFETESWLKPDVLSSERATLCTGQTVVMATEVFLLLVENLLFHDLEIENSNCKLVACKIKLQNNGSLIICSAYVPHLVVLIISINCVHPWKPSNQLPKLSHLVIRRSQSPRHQLQLGRYCVDGHQYSLNLNNSS